MKHLPDFRSPTFLNEHLLTTLGFYDGRCLDPAGGLFQFYKDDGQVYDRHTRHLVSSTRFVITFADAARAFPQHPRASAWLGTAREALRFVEQVHRDPVRGGYAWQLHWQDGVKRVLDATQQAYGLAFVVLAHAHALRAGIDEAAEGLPAALALLDRHFWEPEAGLYADEASPDWGLGGYRGQNANMHACEALMAAFEATGDRACLERADTIADAVTRGLAGQAHGLIWEHYDSRWQADWEFNRHDSSNIFKPWGFQTGHHAEWAKLLLTLERLTPGLIAADPDNWRVHRARELFAAAMQHGWDRHHQGLAYGFAPAGNPAADTHQRICDGHKYHWVHAEALAAAALLGERTGEGGYWDWYDRIWTYAWTHLVDHRHGAWFRILSPDNHRLNDEKSPAGKVDYHNLGACHEALGALTR